MIIKNRDAQASNTICKGKERKIQSVQIALSLSSFLKDLYNMINLPLIQV